MITNKLRNIIAILQEEELENIQCYNIESALRELIITLGYESLLTNNDDTMFELVEKFETIFPDLISGGDIVKVSPTSCERIFRNCQDSTIDLRALDTSKITNMHSMFQDCQNLTSIDVSSLDTSNVKNFMGMFDGCYALEELDLSSWDTSSAALEYDEDEEEYLGAFMGFITSHALRKLDIRSITFNLDDDAYNEMIGAPNDCLIIVKDNTAKTYINTYFSRYTNVKTAEEYEASL